MRVESPLASTARCDHSTQSIPNDWVGTTVLNTVDPRLRNSSIMPQNDSRGKHRRMRILKPAPHRKKQRENLIDCATLSEESKQQSARGEK
jgi:hypothetical protein